MRKKKVKKVAKCPWCSKMDIPVSKKGQYARHYGWNRICIGSGVKVVQDGETTSQ